MRAVATRAMQMWSSGLKRTTESSLCIQPALPQSDVLDVLYDRGVAVGDGCIG